MAGEVTAAPRPRMRILDVVEALAKLIGASAVLLVALFANSLQAKLTGVSIQSQREQADSQLRASMFNSLITPLAGSPDKPMSPDREVILTELLALNFNESFEMKPLMEDAINRIKAERSAKSKDEGDDPREPLWSTARKIAEKQKSAIAREWSTSEADKPSGLPPLASVFRPWKSAADSETPGCAFYSLNLDGRTELKGEPVTANVDCQISGTFGDIIDVKSPDGTYTLRMVVVHPNWEDQTITVSAQPFLAMQKTPKPTDTQYKFTLTWLDLPLTDNTVLSDGNRFAVYLRTFYDQTVSINVVWFPKGYFTPRERPMNHNEVQELLGRKQQ